MQDRPDTYDLELVVDEFRKLLPGVHCYVEQTGGSTATIYAGEPYYVDYETHELVGAMDADRPGVEHCRPVMAGPGWFEGPGWTHGRAHPDEFSLGYDCLDAGIDGDRSIDTALDPVDERALAGILARLYREHPRVLAGEIR